jgi:hypothetical protein
LPENGKKTGRWKQIDVLARTRKKVDWTTKSRKSYSVSATHYDLSIINSSGNNLIPCYTVPKIGVNSTWITTEGLHHDSIECVVDILLL